MTATFNRTIIFAADRDESARFYRGLLELWQGLSRSTVEDPDAPISVETQAGTPFALPRTCCGASAADRISLRMQGNGDQGNGQRGYPQHQAGHHDPLGEPFRAPGY